MKSSGAWAVLPVKNLENVKQRLSEAMTQAERTELFAAALEDVLTALSGARSLNGILVVTRDDRAAALARKYGARVLAEDANRGHTEASTLGARTLAAEGATTMVQVPGDMPLLAPEDINEVLAAHHAAPSVTIAPSGDELGSNCVACSPPDVLPLRFGDNSFFPHCERSRSLGIEPTIVRRPAFELDLDTPDDVLRFLTTPSATRAYRYLVTSGIADRLRGFSKTSP